MKIKKIEFALLILVVLFFVSGCSASDTEKRNETSNAGVSLGSLPFPNNRFFRGSTDGTLNIQVSDPDDLTDPLVALNTLDGFSTTTPWTMPLDSTVNGSTVQLGSSIRFFEVETNQLRAVTRIVSELNQDRVAAIVNADSLVIVPLQPLDENTDYMAVVTNAVTTTNGDALTPGTEFQEISGTTPLTGDLQYLERARVVNNSMLAIAESVGIPRDSVVQVWSARTQTISAALQAVKDTTTDQYIVVKPLNATSSELDSRFRGLTDVYVGTIDLPYYKDSPSDFYDISALRDYWKTSRGSALTLADSVPAFVSMQRVPLLLTVPNTASGQTVPAAGWPITIFQHGLRQNRTNVLAIGDTMAQFGIATIAIDLPMHGLPSTHPLSASLSEFDDAERNPEVDLVNNVTGKAGPDGFLDPSGAHFFSPGSLLGSRDNFRQAAADIMVLSASLANIDAVPLDVSKKTLIGHSFGAGVSTLALAFDDSITAATLGMAPAGLGYTTVASSEFGPLVIEGLEDAGIREGTPGFEQYKIISQSILDSGDSINFGARVAARLPLHLISATSDTVVPNVVPGAALAGTEALIRVMGLPSTSQDTTSSAVVRFSTGGHESLVSSEVSLAATAEMQTQAGTFAASSGTFIDIDNSLLVQ